MDTYKKNWFKFALGFVVCLSIRLLPFRPPNFEPILATQMPFSKAYGRTAGFLFAFISILLYDIITHKVGMWTYITAFTYGILGIWAVSYFKNKKNNSWTYVKFAFIGTIFFDAVTGLSIGPLFYSQPFAEALTGQIPFTLYHLVGNILFAAILSPALYRYVIENPKFESSSLLNIIKTKQA